MKRKLMIVVPIVSCMLWSAVVALGLEPPLPEGAYPEWSSEKAWRRSSPTRDEICLNGLWRFRSEPRLEPVEVVETYFDEDIEASTISEWELAEIPGGGSISAVPDTSRKTRGNASMRVDLQVPPATNFYHIVRYIKGIPTGVKLVLRADMWSEMERGELHVEVQDARDYKFYTVANGKFSSTGKWKTIECEFILPTDTKEMKILILRNHGCTSGCKGTVWIDNLRIVKVGRPAAPGITPPGDNKWGFTKVPGSWKGRVYWDESDPGRKNPQNLRFGWFDRDVTIPSDWGGRHIAIHFDRVSTDARVYINSKEIGALGFMGGEVDITDYVRLGETTRLSVLVEGRNSWIVLPTLLTKPSKSWRAKLGLIGIVGDVFLVSGPPLTLPRLDRSRVVTSVRKHRITVYPQLSMPVSKKLPDGLSVRCEVRDGDTVVKTFEEKVRGDGRSLVCSSGWGDARLWDVGKPNLYTLSVSLLQNGRVIDEALPERFGFRELEIRDKYFYLNDIKLNLVPCSYWAFKGNWGTKDAMRHWLKGARKAGYNFVYLGETDRPGKPAVASHFLEACDELGMLAAVSPLGIGHSAYSRVDRAEVWEPWTEIVRERVQKDWNHPSLVMWRMNMNLNCYSQDQNPLVLDGRMDFKPESRSAVKEAAMLKSNAFVKSIDPTRPTYNHACGKSGEVYNLNNYLGWPERQDLREWLRVWAKQGEKPMYMAEQATPYPGDFQMRDPTNWWTNEPVMTEYGAIALGDRSYELEEYDYVDVYDWCWREKEQRWNSTYGYFCFNYPPILDECSTRYYEALMPAWRTWGISGGVNMWENTWRRLIKRQKGSVFREVPPRIPLETDWAGLQRPGFSMDNWEYASGGGGEIRCLFDLGRPEEREYFEPTLRGKVIPELIAPLYAYIGGSGKEWFAQDHAYRSGEKIAKSVVILNDLRETRTFTVHWQVEVGEKTIAGKSISVTVPPAESAQAELRFRAPAVAARTGAEIIARVSTVGGNVPVKPFSLQIYPEKALTRRQLTGWALFDPVGKTSKAMYKSQLQIPKLKADDTLPPDLQVLVIGCGTLTEYADARVFADLATRVEAGLQVLVFEQTSDVLSEIFGLRSFTPGVRQVWIRDADNPILKGITNTELADWRGETTLGPLDGPPEDLDQSQREARVWRCSQRGVVASAIVEKPHIQGCRPLLDTGFDLRYMALWECLEGAGRMVFCQLDITDRVGLDPVADRLLANLLADLDTHTGLSQRSAGRVADSANAPLAGLPMYDGAVGTGSEKILVVPRGSAAWLEKNRGHIAGFLAGGGRLVAAGLGEGEAQLLAGLVGNAFSTEQKTLWLNPLETDLPAAFSGVSPAAIHWRTKLTVPAVADVPVGGWRSGTGVLAVIPVGKGQIIWISSSPRDFDPGKRPDLVFSKVNTERLYSIILTNLGVRVGDSWASRLGPGAKSGTEKQVYTDTRRVRDDPYAYMRW